MYPKEMHEEYIGFRLNPIYGGVEDTSNRRSKACSTPDRDFTGDKAASIGERTDVDTRDVVEDSLYNDSDDEIKSSNVSEKTAECSE